MREVLEKLVEVQRRCFPEDHVLIQPEKEKGTDVNNVPNAHTDGDAEKTLPSPHHEERQTEQQSTKPPESQQNPPSQNGPSAPQASIPTKSNSAFNIAEDDDEVDADSVISSVHNVEDVPDQPSASQQATLRV